MIKFWIYIFLILSLTNCKKAEDRKCFKGKGKSITEKRNIKPAPLLVIHDNVNIIFTNDTSEIITLEGGENMLEFIRIDATPDQINIKDDNNCNWLRDFDYITKIYIGKKYVKNIINYGYGKCYTSEPLTADSIFLHHYGNGDWDLELNNQYVWMDMDKLGDMTFRGNTNTLVALTYDLGVLNSKRLKANEVYLQSRGQGDVHVSAENILGAEIFGEGNVYYSGPAPTKDLKTTGIGKFIAE